MSADITLSDSMKLYKSGIKELNDAQKLLQDAKIEFQQLSKD
jgi:exodeoxyribonuclease VII small subunit